MDRLEKLLSLFECKDHDSWSSTLFTVAADCGFEHALFGIVPSKSVPLETAFLKSNYPPEWRQTYDAEQMHYVDPTVSHCLGSVLPIAWKPNTFKGQAQHEFYEQACGYGLRSGICLPIHGATGEFGVLSFVSHDIDHVAKNEKANALAQLSLIRDYALESSGRFFGAAEMLPGDIKLTRRELECLKWMVVGKTSWEISKILICSEDNINFHVKNIKKKLNVGSRQQAVVKAIKIGLVYPS